MRLFIFHLVLLGQLRSLDSVSLMLLISIILSSDRQAASCKKCSEKPFACYMHRTGDVVDAVLTIVT